MVGASVSGDLHEGPLAVTLPVDLVLAAALVGRTRAPLAAAVGAVLLYRVISLGGLLAIGWCCIGVRSLADGPAASIGHGAGRSTRRQGENSAKWAGAGCLRVR